MIECCEALSDDETDCSVSFAHVNLEFYDLSLKTEFLFTPDILSAFVVLAVNRSGDFTDHYVMALVKGPMLVCCLNVGWDESRPH